MFVVVSSLTEKFYKQEMLEKLRNMPAMTWTPGIPSRFADKSVSEINLMFRDI